MAFTTLHTFEENTSPLELSISGVCDDGFGDRVELKDVETKHLELLGISLRSLHFLEMDGSLVSAALRPDSPSSLILARSCDQVQNLISHFVMPRGDGSREIVQHYLNVAAGYAQACLDGSPQLRSRFQSQNGRPERPTVGLIPDFPLSPVEATSGTETLTFQGELDYAIGQMWTIAETEEDLDRAGGHHLIGFGSSDILSAIAVVESLDEMDHANARVMMEVLIVMGLRHKSDTISSEHQVAIALTNGIYWTFFMAHRDEGGLLRIFQAPERWNIDEHSGFIIEFLKDMARKVQLDTLFDSSRIFWVDGPSPVANDSY